MTIISTTMGRNTKESSLRRNGIAIIVNKRVQNGVLGCDLKNDSMISVHFQGKPFNITVIQETPGVTGKFGLRVQNEAGQRLTEFCQENTLVMANTLFQNHKR